MTYNQELNNAWTITNPPISSKTQLTLKIEPPFQNHIYVYGVEKGNVGNNKTQALFSGSTGYVGIDGYQDGSLICFVVLRNSLAGDEISWYDHCHELDKDEESQEQLNIDLNSLVTNQCIFVLTKDLKFYELADLVKLIYIYNLYDFNRPMSPQFLQEYFLHWEDHPWNWEMGNLKSD